MVNLTKNNRGQVLVLVALSLIIILGFAALAIDLGYFYHTKNQLQGAADAAALAGAVELDGTNAITQTDARTEAKKYGELNIAAGSAVQLSSDGNNALSQYNDITVGNWNASLSSYSTTSPPVNAVEVRARGTQNDPAGFSRIFGKIFNTTKQDIRAQSIAMSVPAGKKPIVPFCLNSCNSGNIRTPLTGNPPGLRYYLTGNNTPKIAWTSWGESNSNKNNIEAYWTGNSPLPQKYCNEQIYTNNGQIHVDLVMVSALVTANSATYTIKGYPIYGYKTLVPVLNNCKDGTDPGMSSSGGSSPLYISHLTEFIITYVDTSGGDKSFYIVGTGDCANCALNESIFKCEDCSTTTLEAMKAKLVQ